MSKNWHYAEGDRPIGPIPEKDLAGRFASGELPGDTLVWTSGMAEWAQAATLAEFAPSLTGAPPPLPAGADSECQAAAFVARRAALTAHAPGASGTSATGAGSTEPLAAPSGPGSHGAPARGFGEAVMVCMRKFVTFSGRASRSEYWYFVLFMILAQIVTSLLDMTAQSPGIFTDLAGLAFLLPSLSVTWRRLHDTDRSGWWVGSMYLMMIFAGVAVMTTVGVGDVGGGSNAQMPVILLGALALGVVAAGEAITVFIFTLQRGVERPTRFG